MGTSLPCHAHFKKGRGIVRSGISLFLAALLTASAFGQTQLPASGQLGIALEKESTLVWGAKAGRVVRIKEPQLTLEDPNDHARLPFKV